MSPFFAFPCNRNLRCITFMTERKKRALPSSDMRKREKHVGRKKREKRQKMDNKKTDKKPLAQQGPTKQRKCRMTLTQMEKRDEMEKDKRHPMR